VHSTEKSNELAMDGIPVDVTVGNTDTVYPNNMRIVSVVRRKKCVGGSAKASSLSL
jgi:hypothetical protein